MTPFAQESVKGIEVQDKGYSFGISTRHEQPEGERSFIVVLLILTAVTEQFSEMICLEHRL